MEAAVEPSVLPVTAKEAVSELSVLPVMAIEAVNEYSVPPVGSVATSEIVSELSATVTEAVLAFSGPLSLFHHGLLTLSGHLPHHFF